MTDMYFTDYGEIRISPEDARRMKTLQDSERYAHPLQNFIRERYEAIRDHIEATAKARWEWRSK